jgi:hypothetical protein
MRAVFVEVVDELAQNPPDGAEFEAQGATQCEVVGQCLP